MEVLYTVLFSIVFLAIGLIIGWQGAERYIAFLQFREHDYEELFEKNPHPELFDKDGKLNRGDYISLGFDPDFNPDEDGWEITRDGEG